MRCIIARTSGASVPPRNGDLKLDYRLLLCSELIIHRIGGLDSLASGNIFMDIWVVGEISWSQPVWFRQECRILCSRDKCEVIIEMGQGMVQETL